MGMARIQSGNSCTEDFQVPLQITDPNVSTHSAPHFSGMGVSMCFDGTETCYMASFFDIIIGLVIKKKRSHN